MIATKLKVRLYPDPCLRTKAAPVREVGSIERILINSMIMTMNHHKGIGLAAPQVGISERIIVVDVGEGPFALVNPKMVRRSGEDVMEEGCLSLPTITVNVKRPNKVIVRYIDENNQEVERLFQGLLARVIQHETDHLDGKLILDYLKSPQLKKLEPQLKALEEGKIPSEPTPARK